MTDEINDAFEDTEQMVENATVTTAENVQEEVKEEANARESESKAETPKEEEKSVPLKALMAERQKRRELEEWKREQEAKQQESVEAPDPQEDPEGYKSFVMQQAKQELVNERINTSRNKMLNEVVDYEQKERVYKFLEAENPDLRNELLAHPDPARFAYERAKEYETSLRSEIEKDILASAKSNQVVDDKKQQAVSAPDLTGATGIGKNSEQLIVDNPNDMNSIFKDSLY